MQYVLGKIKFLSAIFSLITLNTAIYCMYPPIQPTCTWAFICGKWCMGGACAGVSTECAVQIYVSLGHGRFPALPLTLLFVGLFFTLSLRFGNFPLEPLVARLVGSVLHPYPPNAEHRGNCGEWKGWIDSDWEAWGRGGVQLGWCWYCWNNERWLGEWSCTCCCCCCCCSWW